MARLPPSMPVQPELLPENIPVQSGRLLTTAEIGRAREMLLWIAKKALNDITKREKTGWFSKGRRLSTYTELAFEKAVLSHCKMIFDAAKVKPAQLKATKDKVAEELREKRRAARKSLADELRLAKQKLRSLKRDIANMEAVVEARVLVEEQERRKHWRDRLLSAKARLKSLQNAYAEQSMAWMKRTRDVMDESALARLYPDVPPPSTTPTKEGLGLPDAPGIYFLWSGDVVEYVGQSVRLNCRLSLGGHHQLRADHRVSFLFFDARELTWAECYYIGALRPQLNFGRRAKHYEPLANCGSEEEVMDESHNG